MPRPFLITCGVALVVGFTIYARPRVREHGRMLRVMTLNAHAGVNARGVYDLPRIAHAIADAHPDVVGVQELTRNHDAYACDDQPALLAALLRQITGRTWSQAYVNEWVTDHRRCVETGRGDGVETEGLALFAPEALTHVEFVRLWNTRIGLSAQLASLQDVSIVVTHLAANRSSEYGEALNRRLTGDRARQIGELLPWAHDRARTRILVGDFNAVPDAPELRPVLAEYHDAYGDAASSHRVSGAAVTHGRWRIDYVFFTPSPALRLEHADILDTSSLLPPRPEISDHRPVVASFRTGA